MLTDLHSALFQLRHGQRTAQQWMEHCLEQAQSRACAQAFSHLLPDAARTQAAATPSHIPLGGLAVSVKDLFDVQGLPTRASARVLAQAQPALHDSPAVARLRAAGAALIGKTHMVEFAFSGVGTNPHYGTPAAWDGRFGALTGEPRVPGGSSSGAAVSVATGAAFAALGSDTGGSLRIPAALCGIVGFKATARLVPTAGTIPLSTTLDTAGALTRSVRDALLLHEILAQRRVTRSTAPLSAWRLAVPHSVMLDGLEPHVAQVFQRTLHALRQAGARIDEIALPQLHEVARINASGGFSAAESYAWHRARLAQPEQAALYDPRVRQRIERGASMSAADYIDLLHARQDWITRMQQALQGFDALLSPTVAITAPTLASVAPATGEDMAADAARDQAFQQANSLLLRNTSIVNLLDGCALSLPCHQAGELPVGLMLWHAAEHDDALLNVAQQVAQTLQFQ